MFVVCGVSLYITTRSLDGESSAHRREAAQLRLAFTDATTRHYHFTNTKKVQPLSARDLVIQIRSADGAQSTTKQTNDKTEIQIRSGHAPPSANDTNDEFIPEALLPITFEGCCEPEKEDLFFPQTCLTEKACKIIRRCIHLYLERRSTHVSNVEQSHQIASMFA
jgi:hypothetical protein